MNDQSLIRMEKRAANKGGILLIILIALIGLGVGGYILYRNFDNINWPWEEKQEEKDEEKEETGDSNNSSGGKLHLPEISPTVNVIQIKGQAGNLYITKLIATSKGYELDFKLELGDLEELDQQDLEKFEVECEKILVDDFEISPKFELEITPYSKTATTKVIIPMSELENLEIKSFRALTFFLTLKSTIDGSTRDTITESRMTAYQSVYVDNTKKIKASFNTLDSVRIQYYKKIEAEDATYLYYIVENNNKVTNHKIEIKKLVINDEAYNKPSINVESHYNSKTIFYIKIPRKDFKEVNKITSAFFILRPEGEDQAIFITNDVTVDYEKEETK